MSRPGPGPTAAGTGVVTQIGIDGPLVPAAARDDVGPELSGLAVAITELAPMLRRATDLDHAALVRITHGSGRVSGFVRLPFEVLVGRSIAVPHAAEADPARVSVRPGLDVVTGAAELLRWLDAKTSAPVAGAPVNPAGAVPPTTAGLPSLDAKWRSATPPRAGWRRVDSVPGGVLRSLVATGLRVLDQARDLEGPSAGQPRPEVTDSLLNSKVLEVVGDGVSASVTLRTVSAVVRMGFVDGDAPVSVDVCGSWTRLAATYGNAYAQHGLAQLRVR